MLPSEQELSQVLGALYDAATDATLWIPFLQQLGQSTGARSGLFLMHSAGQDVYTISRSWEIDPGAVRLYQEHYYSFDVWAKQGLSKPAGTVCISEELCTRKEIEATEFYHDLMLACEIEYGMFSVVENSPSRWASISLFRGNSGSAFEHGELEILQFLTPHIRRAFELHFQFSDLKARSANLETALDSLSTGVVFFGLKGEIIYMNQMASTLVSQRDGLFATRDGLRAERQNESDLLARTVLEAASKSNGIDLSARRIVEVSRRTRPALQVVVSPIRNQAIDTSQRVAAVAFVNDPLQRRRPPQDELRICYGLTPAECRVALLLADGRSPREIAQMIGVSFNTVRSQIKSVFSKAGVKRQGELIRLLLDHAGPVINGNPTPYYKTAMRSW